MHPENSKTKPAAQLPALTPIDFGSCEPCLCHLFRIREEGSLGHGLELAQALSEGMYQLSSRVADSINTFEDVNRSEIRALAFLAETVAALTCGARLAIVKAGGAQ